MYQKLLNLEKDFFRIACISNREWLTCTLHDDFVEGGKSGQLSNKEEVIDGLLTRKEDRIILSNFDMGWRTSITNAFSPSGKVEL